MRPRWILPLVLVAGCSTHPIVDVRDSLFPGRMDKDRVKPYGGVCVSQGAPAFRQTLPIPISTIPGATPPILGAPAPGVVPPAAPLPAQTAPPVLPGMPPPTPFPPATNPGVPPPIPIR